MRYAIIYAAALVLLSACASSVPSKGSVPGCPKPAGQTSEYHIGPGDSLNIVVWRNAELSANVPVRPDGRISTPLVDDMQAAGKTPTQLADDMEAILGEYIRTPEVSVIVTGQGVANQIQVIGEVRSPQSLSYREGLKLLDVIVAVGGLSEFAAGNRGRLVRQTETGQNECRLRINDLMKGDMRQNLDVFPGDVIVVPETMF